MRFYPTLSRTPTETAGSGVRATPRLSGPGREGAGRKGEGTEYVRRHTVGRRGSRGTRPRAGSTTPPSSRSSRHRAGTEVTDHRAVLGTACFEEHHPVVYDSFVLDKRDDSIACATYKLGSVNESPTPTATSTSTGRRHQR